MSAKDYFKHRPEGFADKDIFVCESRYSIKLRQFKKIKNWPFIMNVPLVPREVPLEPKRVVSVFKERVEKHKDELAELQLQEALIEKEKPVSYDLFAVKPACVAPRPDQVEVQSITKIFFSFLEHLCPEYSSK